MNNISNISSALPIQETPNSPPRENRKRAHSPEEIFTSLSASLRTSIDANENNTTSSTTIEAIRQLGTVNNTEFLSINSSTFLEQVLTENTTHSASESTENNAHNTNSLVSFFNFFGAKNALKANDYVSASSKIGSSNSVFQGDILDNDDLIRSMDYLSLEDFKKILDQRVDLLEDINECIMTDEMSLTCLLWAARAKRLDIIQYLVEEKHATIDSQDNLDDEWYTSIYWAMEEGSLEIAEYLVSKGALLNATFQLGDEPWDTILGYHCFASRFAKLQFIVETLKADVNAPDELGRTPLSSTLDRIIDFSGHSNEVNQETIALYRSTGLPPGVVEECKKIAKVVLYLIRHGADVNQTLEYLTEKKNQGASSAELAELALTYILDLGAASYLKSSLSRELGINRLTWIGHNL